MNIATLVDTYNGGAIRATVFNDPNGANCEVVDIKLSSHINSTKDIHLAVDSVSKMGRSDNGIKFLVDSNHKLWMYTTSTWGTSINLELLSVGYGSTPIALRDESEVRSTRVENSSSIPGNVSNIVKIGQNTMGQAAGTMTHTVYNNDKFHNVSFAAGYGIDFSGTPNYSGMTSEVLDDYEEGTWTPVVKQGGCSVTTVHKAVYVKIGKSVTVTTYITIGGGGTGTRFELEGLPFNSEETGYACGSADGGGGGFSMVRTQSNSDYLRFKRAASPNDWAVGSAMDNEHLIFALTYFT